MENESLEILIFVKSKDQLNFCSSSLENSGYEMRVNCSKWTYSIFKKNYDFNSLKFSEIVTIFNPGYKAPIPYVENRLIVEIGKKSEKFNNFDNYAFFESPDNFIEKLNDFKNSYLIPKIKIVENHLPFDKIKQDIFIGMFNELKLKKPLDLKMEMKMIDEEYCCGKIYCKLKVFNPSSNVMIKGADLFDF